MRNTAVCAPTTLFSTLLTTAQVCLNCSSRTLRMVADVFFYALKSVLYPLQPLYDRYGGTAHSLLVTWQAPRITRGGKMRQHT
jgi:hypothetical protein